MYISYRNIFRIGLLFLTWLLVTPVSAIDFVHEVMPILKKHCGKCHTGAEKKGGFAMN